MQREFKISCVEDDVDVIANIAFQAGKGSCGLVMSDHDLHTAYGYGSKADAVRVYSALKRNGVRIRSSEGV